MYMYICNRFILCILMRPGAEQIPGAKQTLIV